jgi:hypothetical protein
LGAVDQADAPNIYLAPDIYLALAEGGTSSAIDPDFDMLVTQMSWRADGIYFDSGVKGETHIFRMDPPTGALKQLSSGARNVHSYDAEHSRQSGGDVRRRLVSRISGLRRPRMGGIFL